MFVVLFVGLAAFVCCLCVFLFCGCWFMLGFVGFVCVLRYCSFDLDVVYFDVLLTL